MESLKDKTKKSFSKLKQELNLKNVMQSPRIEKVVINAGVGSFADKKKIELAEDRLSRIAGQRAVKRGAKKSIAAFKVRENDPVGLSVTLRGERMWSFLDKLLNVALPRTKDFRGISEKGADGMGNYTLGIKEHTVFPETSDEELKDIFGFSITIVTNLTNREATLAFLKSIGFPFRKIAQ